MSGAVTPYELRADHRRLHPDVYAPKRVPLSLRDRTLAAWLWSRRKAVISGLTASALHGSKWIDDDVIVELIWPNHRAPRGVITRNETLQIGETQSVGGLEVTTPDRTAFDLARRGPVGVAVARLDALARATDFKSSDVIELLQRHRHLRGIGRLPTVLDLVDAGAQSPRETWLRLLLIDAGFPRPQTQIPVLSPSGYRRYYLDMGWSELKVAVEYDGDQHRVDRDQFRNDIARLEYVTAMDWKLIRVVAGDRRDDIVQRVGRARELRLRRRR